MGDTRLWRVSVLHVCGYRLCCRPLRDLEVRYEETHFPPYESPRSCGQRDFGGRRRFKGRRHDGTTIDILDPGPFHVDAAPMGERGAGGLTRAWLAWMLPGRCGVEGCGHRADTWWFGQHLCAEHLHEILILPPVKQSDLAVWLASAGAR